MSSTSNSLENESEELSTLIESLSQNPERESVASEVEVLRSIYGEDAVQLWRPPRSQSQRNFNTEEAIRYTVEFNLLPPHEDISIKILVSLPVQYPKALPPQLQLLSRYVGAFGADVDLFGTILRTFISITGVQWTADNVCVFDGLQNVAEKATSWYRNRLDLEKTNALEREIAKESSHAPSGPPAKLERHYLSFQEGPILLSEASSQTAVSASTLDTLLDGIETFVAEPIVDRKSVFVGRACRISHPSQVPLILSHLMADKHIARAAHPTINAWRCQVGDLLHQDNDDDGESAAGGRLAHLLQILEVNNVLVIVTRHFGGIHLGPDRFKHINQAARSALDLGRFLETDAMKKPGRNRKH